MENYKKQEESKQDHKPKRSQRIKDLLLIAGVEYVDYIQALMTSRTGYSVVQQRDLDEVNINSYNVEWIRWMDGFIYKTHKLIQLLFSAYFTTLI